jgi:hypothetical protein
MSKGQIVEGICKLCLTHQRLCVSHLLPRGIYVRSRGPGDTSPYIMTSKGEMPSQHQYKQHLLCSPCEQRLSDNGERYVLGLTNDRGQNFPLLNILKKSQITCSAHWSQYSAADTPMIDRKQLAYFGISIFWRASVATWRDTAGLPDIRIDLGSKYNEELRLFLLGKAGIPRLAFLVVYVCSDSVSARQSFAPANNRKTKEGKLTGFAVRGIEFIFGIGKSVPRFQQNLSLINSEPQWIHLKDCDKYRMWWLDARR